MTSQDDVVLTSANEWMLTQLGLTWHWWWHQRTKFWRVRVRGGTWQREEARDGAWRRVPVTPRIVVAHGRSDEDDVSQKGRLERLLSNGAICGLIGEAEVMVAARQWSLMYWSRGGGSGAAYKNGCGWHPRRQDCLRAAHQRIRVVALIPC